MTADNLDFAAELAEREREALAKVRKPTAQRTGFCLNERCGEPLQVLAAAFCNLECSVEAQRITELRKLGSRLLPD